MTKRSAGVLLYRRCAGSLQVLLVHPGGPFWRNKQAGAWQIPKGLVEEGEDPAAAARRETEEELGLVLAGTPEPLAVIRQAGGKVVEAYALEQDINPEQIRSNLFSLEWPPRSGRLAEFPEIDAARWVPIEDAPPLMLKSQLPLLDALRERLGKA
jgi:predicted NUDIX family NTP pyrophosphohydrolase